MVKQTPRRKSALSIGKEETVLRNLPQVPGARKEKEPFSRDRARSAKAPGLRLSKTGNKYWETRENRSDRRGTKL